MYNILQQNLLHAYFDNGDERERSYVVENTVFVMAEYFAWTEIIRRDIQYVNLAKDDWTRQLTMRLDRVQSLLRSDDFAPQLRVFAGEQRAIGERLTEDGPHGRECMGYAAFLDSSQALRDPLIDAIRQDVKGLSRNLPAARPRLVAIQQALIDLLEFLDPQYIRSPKKWRQRIPSSPN